VDSGLYVDNQYVLDAAERYGFEYADTAAYVADAVLRYPDVEIYRDSIHMKAVVPNGRTGQPSGGYEVWARAIRSTIPLDSTFVGTVVTTHNFESGLDDFTPYGSEGKVTVVDGRLKAEKNTATSGQWGADVTIAEVNIGDTVHVTATLTYDSSDWDSYGAGSLGLNTGGWKSNQVSLGPATANGVVNIDATLTTTAAGTWILLFFANQDDAPAGTAFFIDDVTITVNSTVSSGGFQNRTIEKEEKNLPSPVVVKDETIYGDAHVILPQDERLVDTGSGSAGTLVAAQNTSSAFASRFYSGVLSTENALNIGPGEKASFSSYGVIAASMVRYIKSGDGDVVVGVYSNNSLKKTLTLTNTLNREGVTSLLDADDISQSAGTNHALEVRVVSGTLRVHAFILWVPEVDFIKPEEINYRGTWSGPDSGGAPGTQGYHTDTADDLAFFKCPEDAQRLYWVVTNKSVSKPLNHWSGRSETLAQTNTGANHVRLRGGHLGPGEMHYIQNTETLIGGGDTSGGWALHVGGAMVVYDR